MGVGEGVWGWVRVCGGGRGCVRVGEVSYGSKGRVDEGVWGG